MRTSILSFASEIIVQTGPSGPPTHFSSVFSSIAEFRCLQAISKLFNLTERQEHT